MSKRSDEDGRANLASGAWDAAWASTSPQIDLATSQIKFPDGVTKGERDAASAGLVLGAIGGVAAVGAFILVGSASLASGDLAYALGIMVGALLIKVARAWRRS